MKITINRLCRSHILIKGQKEKTDPLDDVEFFLPMSIEQATFLLEAIKQHTLDVYPFLNPITIRTEAAYK